MTSVPGKRIKRPHTLYCAVLGCNNCIDTKNEDPGEISYHRFPRLMDLRRAWIEATGRRNWKPAKSSTICSAHFDETAFQQSKRGSVLLNGTAIPVKNVHNDLSTSVEIRGKRTRASRYVSSAESNNLNPPRKAPEPKKRAAAATSAPPKKKVRKLNEAPSTSKGAPREPVPAAANKRGAPKASPRCETTTKNRTGTECFESEINKLRTKIKCLNTRYHKHEKRISRIEHFFNNLQKGCINYYKKKFKELCCKQIRF